MTKLADFLVSDQHTRLDALRREKEIEALANTQGHDLPLEGEKAAELALAISAHKAPYQHAWLNGRRQKFNNPEQLFARYKSGDTSGRWSLHLQGAYEIDPPKRER